MRKAYELVIKVEIEESDVEKLIDAARACYDERGGDTDYPDENSPRHIPADEALPAAEESLLELFHSNPLLDATPAQIVTLSCGESIPETRPVPQEASSAAMFADDEAEDLDDDQFDECESSAYLCRWPNGDFSVVMAPTRLEAIIALDEWGGADPSFLTPMDVCMIDFRLNDSGEIELAQIGEETSDQIWDQCYPELRDVLMREDAAPDESGEYQEKAREVIRLAVEHERQRLWDDQPDGPEAQTEIGRELQRQLGTVGPVADHYVDYTARKILKSKKGDRGKPN